MGRFAFKAFLVTWLATLSALAQPIDIPSETPLPKVLGAPRSLAVLPSNGAVTDAFAFDIVPGRNGAQPNLAVLYNSFANAAQSGVGWSLETGSIELTPDTACLLRTAPTSSASA